MKGQESLPGEQGSLPGVQDETGPLPLPELGPVTAGGIAGKAFPAMVLCNCRVLWRRDGFSREKSHADRACPHLRVSGQDRVHSSVGRA